MRKVVRITELDLVRIVKRVIKENNAPERNVIDVETGKMVGTHQYGVGFVANKIGERMGYESHPTSIPDGTKMERNELAPTEMRNRRDKDDFAQLRNRRNEFDLNENDDYDDDYDDDYTREMSFKDKKFKHNKSVLEKTIERFDNVEKIIKVLGGEDFTDKFLRYYKPLGLTSVDELIDYKGGYPEDEY
jgi:hypothetical protein